MLPEQALPDPLPAEPMSLLTAWLAEAMRRRQEPDPNAMVLATSAGDHPSARVVLCKEIEPTSGTVRFVSNYDSRKGQELAANPRAALVFHWNHLQRQARLEGAVNRASAADSDSYFASRPRESQIGAHASRQSQRLDSMATLQQQAEAVRQRYPDHVPRPAHWGGYVFWADAVELWIAGAARLHERARWTRELSVACGGALPMAGPWRSTRLQP